MGYGILQLSVCEITGWPVRDVALMWKVTVEKALCAWHMVSR